MNKIPEHKIAEDHHGKIASLKLISADSQPPGIGYAHRDDYYLFLFMEEGEARFSVDFEEYDIKGPMVNCVLPGQVHHVVDHGRNMKSWVLIADSMLVKEEHREIFANASLIKDPAELSEDIIGDLKSCVSMLHKRLNDGQRSVRQDIIHSLLSAYIGLIAEAYQKGLPVSSNERYAAITRRFKSLLAENYKSLKSPSQYAAGLNLSPVYLNEAVKHTTGMTVTGCIRHEIVTQAKRLLYYTDMNVKEVAAELGYEDWAYFTRLFTRASSMSPTQFRKKYLK